jgi:hypothetical protein
VKPAEAARHAACHRSTVGRWIAAGALACDKQGRVKLADVVRLATNGKGIGRKPGGAIDGWPYATPFYVVSDAEAKWLLDDAMRLGGRRRLLANKTRAEYCQEIREEIRNRLYLDSATAWQSSLRLRGCVLPLPDAVQIIRRSDYLANRAEYDRAIRASEIRVLANIIDMLFWSVNRDFFDRDLHTVSHGEGERYSGDTSMAANFFHDSRHYLPFYQLDTQPIEPAVEKVFARYSTRDITLFAAMFILEMLKRQPPHWKYGCKLPFTKAEVKEISNLLAKAKRTGEDYIEVLKTSKHWRRCDGQPLAPAASNDLHAPNYAVQLPATDTFRRNTTGFTLHWLLGITSRKAAYWRRRAKRNYEPIKKSLQQAGALPTPKSDAAPDSDKDDIATVFREAAQRGELAGRPRPQTRSGNI